MALTDYDYLRITHALFSFTRAYEAFINSEQHIHESDLAIQDLAVLIILGQRSPITSRQLSAMMDVSPGMVSIYVQKLLEKGLLRKEQDHNDRRNWWLFLTEDGLQVYKTLTTSTVEFTRQVLSVLDEEEQTLFNRSLQKTVSRVAEIIPDVSGKERLF
ncbi:MAG: MarR family transcriptional regulator [Chloroflexota bacterium]